MSSITSNISSHGTVTKHLPHHFFFSTTTNPHKSISFPIKPHPSFSLRSSLNNDAVSFSLKNPSEMSFYELLGIPETGSLLEIKQAYKQMARKYHPDVSPPGRAKEYTEAFIRVQEAYDTLSDPNTKELYDRDMALGVHLAFTARSRRGRQEMEEKSEWKSRWQSQLSGLKRRSSHKDSNDDNNMSWGARIRRERNASS